MDHLHAFVKAPYLQELLPFAHAHVGPRWHAVQLRANPDALAFEPGLGRSLRRTW